MKYQIWRINVKASNITGDTIITHNYVIDCLISQTLGVMMFKMLVLLTYWVPFTKCRWINLFLIPLFHRNHIHRDIQLETILLLAICFLPHSFIFYTFLTWYSIFWSIYTNVSFLIAVGLTILNAWRLFLVEWSTI